MANKIKHKRSTTTATPTLSNGELGWTESGNVLFIGSFDGLSSIPIAGKRNPGVLTANQALVANSTSMLDTIRLGSATTNSVVNSTGITVSNSTVTITYDLPTAAQVTAGNYFKGANGTWQQVTGGTGSPGGSNTNIQFNDSTAFGGSNNLNWDKSSNTLSLSGNMVANADYISIGNSTVNSVINSISHTIGSNVVANTSALFIGNSTVNTFVNSSSFFLNGRPVGLYRLANGTVSTVSSLAMNLASYGTWSGYRIFLDSIVLSAANNLFVNVSSDGAIYYTGSATRAASINNTAQAILNNASGQLAASNLSTAPVYIVLETRSPSGTTGTAHQISYEIYNHANSYISGFISCTNTSFTTLGGISIAANGATFSGNYSIYGYL